MAYEYEESNKQIVFTVDNESSMGELNERIKELKEVYRKAKAFDEIKKYADEEVDSYMTLYRETKDPVYSLLNSHYNTLLGYIEELERADDER